MSTETSTTPEIPPATRRAAEAIGAEFTAHFTVDMKPIGIGEATILGVPLVKIARAALASLDVEEMAALAFQHVPQLWSSGAVECSCGKWKMHREGDGWKRSTHEFRADAMHAHGTHLVTELRAGILGEVR